MNYTLNVTTKSGIATSIRTMWPILREHRTRLAAALAMVLVNSAATFVGPYIIGRTIDRFVATGDFHGVVVWALVLIGIYAVAFVANYWQMMFMGMVGQRTLYELRNVIFNKLQELPLAFFNANKSGDLISRINNDTSKLNQFFSEIVVRFVGIMVTIIGVGAFMMGINPKLGAFALVPALGIIVITQIISPWAKKKSAASLQAMGQLSGEVQESLENFKVVVAFDRRDFFRDRFAAMNTGNYQAARAAGFATTLPMPAYQMAGIAAQMIVLVAGIGMIAAGHFTVGLLVGFLVYVSQFYNPLQQISQLWSSFQTALAAWERVNTIMMMETDLVAIPDDMTSSSASVVSFDHVTFGYLPEQRVLDDVSLELAPGKTYALVGPTGGGKTTTASLMARLYDPVSGIVRLLGRDIRSYPDAERAELIGFILQDPFLFAGTIQENIFYGNPHYPELDESDAVRVLADAGLAELLDRFDGGLMMPVTPSGGALSLGQKQIIAFLRAVLRKPKLLILDEATANIDTMTEAVLQNILDRLPADTTRVIIAHRLNTIQNADEIFFVSAGSVKSAGSFEHAVEMLIG